jgi:hypothetical protein
MSHPWGDPASSSPRGLALLVWLFRSVFQAHAETSQREGPLCVRVTIPIGQSTDQGGPEVGQQSRALPFCPPHL